MRTKELDSCPRLREEGPFMRRNDEMTIGINK